MASQQAQINSIIMGMKKAVKRKAYDSDSDSSIEHRTNRGNKLRKKARYVHEGQLAAPTGPQVYKRTIEHGGYYRDIISLNPTLVDENGVEVDTDDEDEREAASPAEFNAYAEVRIEHLLAPLTAASDLPNHPTLSKPFVSKALTELTKHAGEMVQKEKASLWRIKHLLTRLSGDNTWIPCESLETDHDFALFNDEPERPQADISDKPKDRDQLSTGTMVLEDNHDEVVVSEGSLKAAELESVGQEPNVTLNGQPQTIVPDTNLSKVGDGENNKVGESNNDSTMVDAPQPEVVAVDNNGTTTERDFQVDEVEMSDLVDGIENSGEPAPRRMRTRAQAQAASDNTASHRARSTSSDLGDDNFISPYFLAPRSSHPDRDLGLPQHEADDIRRLLQLYIQKQEEVCRGVQKVYDGLMKADRCRQQVMKWAKAEGHLRDMSDGEDWYDKEEWDLDEDLKKGQDEEEEDAATTAKKTRTRRQ